MKKILLSLVIAVGLIFIKDNSVQAVSGTFRSSDYLYQSLTTTNGDISTLTVPNTTEAGQFNFDISSMPYNLSKYKYVQIILHLKSDGSFDYYRFIFSEQNTSQYYRYVFSNPGSSYFTYGSALSVKVTKVNNNLNFTSDTWGGSSANWLYMTMNDGRYWYWSNYDISITQSYSSSTTYGYYKPLMQTNVRSPFDISPLLGVSGSYNSDFTKHEFVGFINNYIDGYSLYYSTSENFSNPTQLVLTTTSGIAQSNVLSTTTNGSYYFKLYNASGDVTQSMVYVVDKLGNGFSDQFTIDYSSYNGTVYITPKLNYNQNTNTIFVRAIEGLSDIQEQQYADFVQVQNNVQFQITSSAGKRFTLHFQIRNQSGEAVHDTTYTIIINADGTVGGIGSNDSDVDVGDFPEFPSSINPIDYIVWLYDVIVWLLNLLISFILGIVSKITSLGNLFKSAFEVFPSPIPQLIFAGMIVSMIAILFGGKK